MAGEGEESEVTEMGGGEETEVRGMEREGEEDDRSNWKIIMRVTTTS